MARLNALRSREVSQPHPIAFTPAETALGGRNGMRHGARELRRLLLDEAVGREVHADELAALAMRESAAFHASTLRVLAHSQRIRAMELRGQAAASIMQDDRGAQGKQDRREKPFT